jgi:hypothetical protein
LDVLAEGKETVINFLVFLNVRVCMSLCACAREDREGEESEGGEGGEVGGIKLGFKPSYCTQARGMGEPSKDKRTSKMHSQNAKKKRRENTPSRR